MSFLDVAASVVSTLLTGDGVAVLGSGSQQWGLFLDGSPIVVAESVVRLEYARDAEVSTYPVEEGGFESYDKVQNPRTMKFRFSAGALSSRATLLASVDAAYESLDLYDVVTPEAVYQDVNVIHYDYQREARSVGLLVVEVWVEEIRVTATESFQNTQSASGADPQSGGTVAPQQTSTAEQAQVTQVT